MCEPNCVVGVPQVEVEGDAPHYDQTEVHLQKNSGRWVDNFFQNSCYYYLHESESEGNAPHYDAVGEYSKTDFLST